MNQKKLDKIISSIREDMGVGAVVPTNHTGKNIANFSPVMGKLERRKKFITLPPGSRRNWLKAVKKKKKGES